MHDTLGSDLDSGLSFLDNNVVFVASLKSLTSQIFTSCDMVKLNGQ